MTFIFILSLVIILFVDPVKTAPKPWVSELIGAAIILAMIVFIIASLLDRWIRL